MKKQPFSAVCLTAILFLFPACSSSDGEAVIVDPPTAMAVMLTAEEVARAQVLFEENACVDCHGEDRRGSEAAPSLLGIRGYWTEDTLVKYFYNPEFYMVSDPTVLQRNPGYEITMPPFLDMTEKDRSVLARWVLQESE